MAGEAKIATGTLFNYFATKEAIVGALAEAAIAKARVSQAKITEESLEEELFACVAAELRQLKPHRKYISALFETSLSPLVLGAQPQTSDVLRGQHLELVNSISRRHKVGEPSAVALQLYWTLYTGVLAFWASDKSPKQEDTLALLDQSLAMFVGWLRSESSEAD